MNEADAATEATYSGNMEASGGASRGNTRPRRTKRSRGHIEKLKSGSLRVNVYAGTDAITKRPLYLRHTIPDGPDAESLANGERERLLKQLDEGRHPRSNASVCELLKIHLSEVVLSKKNRATYRRYVRKHVHPFLCRFSINDPVFDAELFDSFYAELGRCREHCRPGHTVDHYTDEPHRCTTRRRPHRCVPLKVATIRRIHFILKGGFDLAFRRGWITINPIAFAQAPEPASGNPDPPTVRNALLLVDAAWAKAYYGPVVWFAAITGARLGELCALRWSDLEITHEDHMHVLTDQDPMECWVQGCRWTLVIERSIEQVGLEVFESGTKTGNSRRLPIDPTDVSILLDLRDTQLAAARRSGRDTRVEDFMFPHPSLADACLRPGAVSTHYGRFAAQHGVKTTFHKLRHYNATELLKAGVPIEVVSRRLGHSSTETTRKFYAAWCPEADPEAATVASGVVATPLAGRQPVKELRRTVAFTLAEQLRASIEAGEFAPGAHLPPMQQLSLDHRVSINGAHAAVNLLAEWGFVTVSRGRRSTVTEPAQWPASTTTSDDTANAEATRETLPIAGGTVDAPAAAVEDLAPVVGRIGPLHSWSPPVAGDEQHDAHDVERPRDERLLQVTVLCGRAVIKTLCVEASTSTSAEVRRLVQDVKANLDIDPSLESVVELEIVDFDTGAVAMTFVLGPASRLRTEVLAG